MRLLLRPRRAKRPFEVAVRWPCLALFTCTAVSHSFLLSLCDTCRPRVEAAWYWREFSNTLNLEFVVFILFFVKFADYGSIPDGCYRSIGIFLLWTLLFPILILSSILPFSAQFDICPPLVIRNCCRDFDFGKITQLHSGKAWPEETECEFVVSFEESVDIRKIDKPLKKKDDIHAYVEWVIGFWFLSFREYPPLKKKSNFERKNLPSDLIFMLKKFFFHFSFSAPCIFFNFLQYRGWGILCQLCANRYLGFV